jgi:ribosomal peptide maturation radical SAM protein 1
MHSDKKKIILISMPFAETTIPSIQLALLETYLKEFEINVISKHLYLKSADFYGLPNYNKLIFSQNGSYAAQILFSKYVFPDHWIDLVDDIQTYFNNKMNSRSEGADTFPFDKFLDQTDLFYNWVIKNIDWKRYEIIGFTINFGQFLPSLAIAKKIKELYPEKIVLFGGSRTYGDLGVKTLELFDYVNFVISGDGEKSLYLLATDFNNYQNIPGLIFRKENKIKWNNNEYYLDLNNLPILSYDSFFEQLFSASSIIQQFFDYYGKLPIELSRGCWWNKCTFCNVKLQNKKYREKNVENFIKELVFLSDKYQILRFQVINNHLPIKNYRILLKEIKNLDRDFTLYIEARANQLSSEDYRLMKEAGCSHIQTGIETFSKNYIKKINKGTRIIDNIASLKFCKEYNIINDYNIVINYPNEENIDFDETKKTIHLFKQYIDPPQISPLIIGFGSYIYNYPEEFNIKNLEFTQVDKLMFPLDVLKRGVSYFYNFKKNRVIKKHDWDQLVFSWQQERNQRLIKGLNSRLEIDKYIFYFEDGNNFLRIYDHRDIQNIRIYILNAKERDIFLACTDIISIQELQNKFSNIADYKIAAILHSLEKKDLLYREENYYLNLPLRINLSTYDKPKNEQKIMIYNSGKQRTL